MDRGKAEGKRVEAMMAVRLPRWLWLFMAAALVWSWSLYLAGWWLTPKGQRYFWVTFDVSDYNAHLRWARQALEGKNRFVNLYTTEEHPALTFNLHDWLIGRFSRWTGIPLHFSLRLMHTLAVITFVFAAWWLARPLLKDMQQRTYMLMLCFLGGVVWSAEIFGRTLVGMPEANTFMALATMPWFVWGKALAALLMGSIMRIGTGGEGRRAGLVVLSGTVSGILLGNIHPYALAPIGYGMVLWFAASLWLSRRSPYPFNPLRSMLLAPCFMLLPAFVTAAWQALAILGDPIYRAEFQFPLETPPFWLLIANYGVIGVLAFLAIPFIVRQSLTADHQSLITARHSLLLATWLMGAFLAVYLTPTMQQRKLIEGAHLPMCVLAAWAWHELVLPRTVVIRKRPLLVLLLVCGITPLTFWVSQFRNFQHNDEIALHYGGVPYYVRERHLKLMDWLAKHSRPGDAVLCAYPLGNYLPVLTGRRVFIGHWAGTNRVHDKLLTARKIWRGEMPISEAKNLFRKHHLRYALATMYERHETKRRHKPEECSQVTGQFRLNFYGEVVYRIGSDAIYRLRW